jgi:hypothetical protein
MRNKPEDAWYNFKFDHCCHVGKVEVAISFNEETLERFINDAILRMERGTGLRFKLLAKGCVENVESSGEQYMCVQAYTTDDECYIFPESSKHTNRYDSRYNRAEWYVPIKRLKKITNAGT